MAYSAPMDDFDARRKLAMALSVQGSDAAPVGHWTQALARALQGAVGGYQLGELRREGEADKAKTSAALDRLMAGGSQPKPSPLASAMMPPGSSADDTTARTIAAESGGNPMARNPRSSAAGPGQFIDSTWLDVVKRNRPDLASLPDPQILAMRTDPNMADLSRDMTAAYGRENGAALSAAGLPVTPGTTYLAHFAGPGGAKAVLSADPAAPVAQILGPKVVQANPFLANMSAGDLRAWADQKMGGEAPVRVASLGGVPGMPAPAPAQPPAGPQVAQAPQARPQPVQPQQAPQPAISPNEVDAIRVLMGSRDPAMRQFGMQLFQAAQTRANQPQFDFKVVGDALVQTNNRTGAASPVQGINATKPQVQTVKLPSGEEVTAFVDPGTRQAWDLQGNPLKIAPVENSVVPPAPPGIDPKIWREEHSKRATADRMPGASKDVTGLRKEVQELPSYKNIAQAAPVYKSMLSAAKRDNRAADVNLIYGMAKIMDPGSVVRESEMSVAQAIATLPQSIQAGISSQFLQTGRLPREVRAAIMEEANSRIQAYADMYEQDAGMFRGIAERNRMDPKDVLQTFGPFDVFVPPAAAAPAPDGSASPAQPAKPSSIPSGKTSTGVQWSVP